MRVTRVRTASRKRVLDASKRKKTSEDLQPPAVGVMRNFLQKECAREARCPVGALQIVGGYLCLCVTQREIHVCLSGRSMRRKLMVKVGSGASRTLPLLEFHPLNNQNWSMQTLLFSLGEIQTSNQTQQLCTDIFCLLQAPICIL